MFFKKIIKVLLILIAVFILAMAGACAYLLLNGREILSSQIEKNLGVKARMSSLRVVFPSSFIIEDLSLGDNIKIARMSVDVSLLGFIKGDIVLNSIILEKPRFKVTRNADETFDFGIPVRKKKEKVAAPPQPQETKKAVSFKPKRVYFTELKISGADIDFIDKQVSPQGSFVMKFSNVDLNASRESLLQLFRMKFQGKGELLTGKGEKIGQWDASGWVDVLARDMDSRLHLTTTRLAYFEPYFIKYSKRELRSGEMDMTGDFKSKSDDLKGDFHVDLKDVTFKEKEETQPSVENVASKTIDPSLLAFNMIFSNEGNASFDFSVKTKMDAPKFEHVKLKKIKAAFFQSTIENALSKQPGGTTQDFKQMGKDFKAIGKEFKKMFKSE